MPAEQVITKKKVLCLHRILCGPPTKLIKQVYDEQKKLDMPRCWSEEIEIIKQQCNLEKYSDEEMGNLSKYSWKKTVDSAIRTKLQIGLESMRKEKSKIANIETFERKEYLTELKSVTQRVAAHFMSPSSEQCIIDCSALHINSLRKLLLMILPFTCLILLQVFMQLSKRVGV